MHGGMWNFLSHDRAQLAVSLLIYLSVANACLRELLCKQRRLLIPRADMHLMAHGRRDGLQRNDLSTICMHESIILLSFSNMHGVRRAEIQ